MHSKNMVIAAVALSCVLVACGGGGGEAPAVASNGGTTAPAQGADVNQGQAELIAAEEAAELGVDAAQQVASDAANAASTSLAASATVAASASVKTAATGTSVAGTTNTTATTNTAGAGTTAAANPGTSTATGATPATTATSATGATTGTTTGATAGTTTTNAVKTTTTATPTTNAVKTATTATATPTSGSTTSTSTTAAAPTTAAASTTSTTVAATTSPAPTAAASTATAATTTTPVVASNSTVFTAQGVSTSSAGSCYALPAMPTVPAGSLKVTDFGAIPNDNLADDDAINAALAALKPGQWLVFPAGRYIQAKSIYVKTARAVLWGNGATLHASNPDDQTIGLAASGASIYGFTLTADTLTRGSAPRHARISIYPLATTAGYLSGNVVRGNTITHTASTPSGGSAAGIFVYHAKDFTIAGNTVKRTLADGIHITAGSYNGKILNNTVLENGDDMIALVSYMNAGWQTQVKSDPTYASSIWSKRVHDVYVSGNSVSGNYWGRGLSVVGAQNVTLLNNTVDRITRAAGILIGQEGSYNTFGVQNILVKGNTLTNIQTKLAAYVPASMLLKITTTAVTGHGGIEVYNYGNASTDAADAALRPYIMSDRIRIEGNKISGVVRDGVRIGVATAEGLIGANSVQSTTFQSIKLQAINNVQPTKARSYCAANLLEGASYANATACQSTAAPVATGATLDCTGDLK